MDFLKNIWNKVVGEAEPEVPQPQPDDKSLGSSIASIFAAGADHVSALFSLFLVEMADVVQRLKGKLICLVFGGLFLLIGYLFGLTALSVYLGTMFELHWVLLCIAGFHLVAGLIALLVASKKRLGPFAPETVNELKSDYECLQIAIKENRNS